MADEGWLVGEAQYGVQLLFLPDESGDVIRRIENAIIFQLCTKGSSPIANRCVEYRGQFVHLGLIFSGKVFAFGRIVF